MALNAQWWSNYFRDVCFAQVHALVQMLNDRLLPQFDSIPEEAETVKQKAFDYLMSRPSDGSIDPADCAEDAIDEAVAYYERMSGLRQGLVNMFAVALYHLHEQHLMDFLRNEVLDLTEEGKTRFLKIEIFTKRLADIGVDVEKIKSWNKIEELRLVANTVKHAEGSSARNLRHIRPDLFEERSHTEVMSFSPPSGVPVTTPISGESIYVTVDDLHQYANAVEEFWREFFALLQQV